MASGSWLGKVIERESDDVWLRTGIRVIVLLIVAAFGLCIVAVTENAITGDVSGITRLAVFSFSLSAIVGIGVALFCLATGLIRRMISRYRRDSN
jgi:hypothetical protein